MRTKAYGVIIRFIINVKRSMYNNSLNNQSKPMLRLIGYLSIEKLALVNWGFQEKGASIVFSFKNYERRKLPYRTEFNPEIWKQRIKNQWSVWPVFNSPGVLLGWWSLQYSLFKTLYIVGEHQTSYRLRRTGVIPDGFGDNDRAAQSIV